MASTFRTAKWWMTRRVTPDYTNQLDLFSEAAIETTVASHPVRSSAASHVRPRPPQQLNFGPWEPLPPGNAPPIPGARQVSESSGGTQDRIQGSPLQTAIGQQDEKSSDNGTSDGQVPSTGMVLDVEPEEKPSRDFRITGAHRIGQGGLHEKARDNIAAIRLLKALEAENREATEDEKSALARYVGWGGMPNV